MRSAWILAAERVVDGVGSLDRCIALEQQLLDLATPPRSLVIDPLATDWHSPLAADHFRSGCAPVEALARARRLILEQGVDAVVISGRDPLRTGYDRAERQRRMAVYGDDYPLTAAYTDLAARFIERQGVDRELFRGCAEALYLNYSRTFRRLHGDAVPLPGERWLAPITELFRGVDCANPGVDFQGRVLVGSDRALQALGYTPRDAVAVAGVGLGLLESDGPRAIDRIVDYSHLALAYRRCCDQAGVDLAALYRAGDALLEVYSCYPVVPMAFLLRSGLVDSLEALPPWLDRHEVTVTGGMNLARAPWNNPALNALIAVVEAMRVGERGWGAVHGNGGLGYRQGVALLARGDRM